MAANNNAFSTLLTRIGFNAPARAVLAHEGRENLNIGKLAEFTTDDDVHSLCHSLRREYQLDDPNAKVMVSALAEDKMKTACFIARHFKRCQRTLTSDWIDDARLVNWKDIRVAENEHAAPEDAPTLFKCEDGAIYEFLEQFQEYLTNVLGTQGRPLAYVIREEIDPPPEADDPAFSAANSRYFSVRAEVIARAAIDPNATAYVEDRRRVFELLRTAISTQKEVYTWIKDYARTQDGRGAWRALCGKYRGESYMRTLANKADTVLQTAKYTGEGRKYDFNKHVSTLKQAHLDLSHAGTTPSGRDKVRRLLDSISCANLEAAKLVILSRDDMVEDFERAVDFLKQQVHNTRPKHLNISRVGVSSQQGTQGDHGGETSQNKKVVRDGRGNEIELRRLPKSEFNALPETLRKALSKALKKAGMHPSQKDSTRPSNGKKHKEKAAKKRKAAAAKAERRSAKKKEERRVNAMVIKALKKIHKSAKKSKGKRQPESESESDSDSDSDGSI